MLAHRPVFLFVMILAPVLCVVFFTSLMAEGLPTDMPAAVVDEDNTPTTRKLVRVLDVMEMADVSRKYYSFSEAHEAMRRGEIYAFFYIPKGTTAEAISTRQPKVSFYTNDAYLVPGNLIMKDMKMTGELIPLALTREKLRAKGLPETEMMAWLQPIQIEPHPIGNPTLDYNVYLSNMVVPGILILLILLTTVYTIGFEWKQQTQKAWYQMAGQRVSIALGAKVAAADRNLHRSMVADGLVVLCPLRVPMSVWTGHDDAHRTAHGAGIAGLRRTAVRHSGWHDARGSMHLFAMGHPVVLAGRLYLSRHRHAPRVAGAVSLVPAAPLLPYLCQPGTRRIPRPLCMVIGMLARCVLCIAPVGTLSLSQGIP